MGHLVDWIFGAIAATAPIRPAYGPDGNDLTYAGGA